MADKAGGDYIVANRKAWIRRGSTRKWFDFVVVDAYNLTPARLLCAACPIAPFAIVIHRFALREACLSFLLFDILPLFLRVLSLFLSSIPFSSPLNLLALGYSDGHLPMSVMNASYASPVADAAFAKISAIAPEGFVQRLLAGVNTWTVVLTLLIGAVLYDQGV